MPKLIPIVVLMFSINLRSMAQDSSHFTLPSIPEKLKWINQPIDFSTDREALRIRTGPLTDMFINPLGTRTTLNAPKALFSTSGDFQLYSRVKVNFKSDFDAGVLIVYANQESWAKLCFEYSPQHKPMIVSVVTKGSSDDANAVTIDKDEVYLRLSRLGDAFAFHYSTDGNYWHLVRYFNLDSKKRKWVGFSAQSPTGEGCEVVFTDITFLQKKLDGLRDGS